MAYRNMKSFISLSLAALLTVSLAGCGQVAQVDATASQPEGVPVEVFTPKTGELVLTTEYIGAVKPDELVSVFPKVAGTVLATHFEVGETVEKGDLLFEIDPTDIQLQVDVAAAGLATARASADQAMGSSYDMQLIQSEAQVESAQMNYNNASKRLREYRDSADETLEGLSNQEQAAWELVQAAELVYKARKAKYDEAVRKYIAMGGEISPEHPGVIAPGGGTMGGASSSSPQPAPSVPDVSQPSSEASGSAANSDANSAANSTANSDANSAANSDANSTANSLPANGPSSENASQSASSASSADAASQAAVSSEVTSGVLAAFVSRIQNALATDSEKEEAKKDMDIKKGLMEGAMNDYQSAMKQYQSAQAAYDAVAGSYDSNAADLRTARYAAQVSYEAAEKSFNLAKNEGYAQAAATVEAQLNQAEASYRAQAKQLEYTKIYAPIGGVVEQKNVEERAMASQQNPAYTVSNKNTMQVNFYVSADTVDTLREGDVVTVENAGTLYPGTIVSIGTMVDEQSGLFKVRAAVEAADNSLKTGLSVKITATTARSVDHILIPQNAVYYENGSPYVYLLKDGQAVKTMIETGVSNAEQVAVLSGITTSDTLIASWHPNLSDGVKAFVKGDSASSSAVASSQASSQPEPVPSVAASSSAASGTTHQELQVLSSSAPAEE